MEQTNRTILFEEINPEKDDLLTLITENDNRNGLSDEEIFRIHEKLVVTSYEEFLDKFDPVIKMQLDTTHCTVDFNQDSSCINSELIQMKNNESLLAMLIHIMDAKKSRKYILTCFEDMYYNIIPRKDVTPFFNKRNGLYKLVEAENADEISTEKQLMELIREYDDGLFLLAAFIEEVNQYAKNQALSEKSDKGIIDDKGRMQIKVIKKAAKYKKTVTLHENMTYEKYQMLVEKCISRIHNSGGYQNGELMQACLMLPVWIVEKRYFEIQRAYEKYLKLYEEIYKKFWMVAKPLLETLIGVREFFAQHQEKQGMCPTLLVANFRPEHLLQGENRKNLELYLNTVNMTSYQKHVIWYAIVPNISGKENGVERPVRERFMATQEKLYYKRNGMEEISLLLDILAKYKIQSFLSMALTQEYTFTGLARKGVDAIHDIVNTFERIEDKDYCIPCFPNFMLISKEDAYQRIGKVITFDDLSEEIKVQGEKIIWLDEIGIEASYVAAGLVAACQCPKYLKKCHGKGVNEMLPGVAYRFSQDQNYMKTASGMLSETIAWTEEMEQEFVTHSKGMLFGQKAGKMVVLTDRTLSYHAGNRLLISMVQTMNYIERRIQYDTQDFKKNLIEQFFQKKPGSTITTWGKVKGGEINALLRDEEELEHQIDEKNSSCTFRITFKENEVVRNKKVVMFKE